MERTLIKKGRKRLELHPLEPVGLWFLEQQRSLTLNQYYEFYYHVLGYQITEYGFKNRMRKLEEFKIIRSERFADGFNGDRFKYLSIGSAGVDLLLEKRFIPDDYNKKQIYSFLQKENLYHFFSTQQAVVNFYRLLKKRFPTEWLRHSKSLSPSQHPYHIWTPYTKNRPSNSMIPGYGSAQAAMRKRLNGKVNSNRPTGRYVPIIKPDWIITSNSFGEDKKEIDRIINIELDTGTETLSELTSKVFRYFEVADRNLSTKFQTIFILPDNTFLSRNKFGDRRQRQQNILNHFKNDKQLMERLNIKISVVTLKQAAASMDRFLFEENS